MSREYFDFKKEHPEVDVGLIEIAFIKCQGENPKSIQEAYEHTQKCARYRRYIEDAERANRLGIFISKVRDWQVGRY